MNKIIKVLNEDHFIRFNNWLGNEDGHLNPVFIGEFSHPTAGNTNAFCKLYNPNAKGLINEIVGFLITGAFNVKQPDYAFIALLPREKIPDWQLIAERRDNVWMQQGADNLICFCTSRLDGKSAAIHICTSEDNYLIPEVADDISKWPQYSAAIALDENIAHADRHFNNLLRLAKQSYAVIDNGRLVNEFAENWNIDMLQNQGEYPNKLIKAIQIRTCIRPSTTNIHKKAILCADGHSDKFKQIEDELEFWLNTFLPEDEKSAFQDFLINRTEEASWLLKRRFHIPI